MKAKLNLKGKKIEIPDVKKVSGMKKFTGLMFKKPETNALLFSFNKQTKQAIHSLFCPDFLAIWLNNNKIIEYKFITSQKLIIKPEKKFSHLLEIPLNKKYLEITKAFINQKKENKR